MRERKKRGGGGKQLEDGTYLLGTPYPAARHTAGIQRTASASTRDWVAGGSEDRGMRRVELRHSTYLLYSINESAPGPLLRLPPFL